jgi:DNA repair exonuclease SbcCD nuclease subunit
MADVHLDSKLTRYLDNEKARERRNELLLTYIDAVKYAAKNGIEVIIIAGDLFDVRKISATARDAVRDSIEQNPEITFFYLRGNHDADSFVQAVIEKNGKLPENLKMFSREWTSYRVTSKDGMSVVITGAEMDSENNLRLVSSLALNHSDFNIVTLHGQETATVSKNDAEVIPLREFRNRGIDYMALGHIHEPKIEKLDARGTYSYSGCLEGRGYDECGVHGFNVIDVTEISGNPEMSIQFVPFARRIIHRIELDLGMGNSGAMQEMIDSPQIARLAKEKLAYVGVEEKDMVRLELIGKISASVDIDTDYIRKLLEDDYYHIKVVDKTGVFINYEDFALDMSLRGEFVRLIMREREQGKLDEETAARITRTGIDVLAGEEGVL